MSTKLLGHGTVLSGTSESHESYPLECWKALKMSLM